MSSGPLTTSPRLQYWQRRVRWVISRDAALSLRVQAAREPAALSAEELAQLDQLIAGRFPAPPAADVDATATAGVESARWSTSQPPTPLEIQLGLRIEGTDPDEGPHPFDMPCVTPGCFRSLRRPSLAQQERGRWPGRERWRAEW